MKNILKNQYVFLALIVGVTSTLYYFFPPFLNIALVIYGVVIVAFLVSGNFKSAWGYIKYLLLGFLIGVILGVAHIDYFPWGILFFILGAIILNYHDKNKDTKASKPNTSLTDPPIDDFDRQYSLLYPLHNKETIFKFLQTGNDAEIMLQDYQRQAEEFGKRFGKDFMYFNENHKGYIELPLEDMKLWDSINNNLNSYGSLVRFIDEYKKTLEAINNNLKKGMSVTFQKPVFDKLLADLYEKRKDSMMAYVSARVMGEEIIKKVAPIKSRLGKHFTYEAYLKEAGTHNTKMLTDRIAEEFQKEWKGQSTWY